MPKKLTKECRKAIKAGLALRSIDEIDALLELNISAFKSLGVDEPQAREIAKEQVEVMRQHWKDAPAADLRRAQVNAFGASESLGKQIH